LFILSLPALSFELGFNQAWIKNNYAHQWINYEAKESERILKLASNANATIVRMWLFEGVNPRGVEWTNNFPIGLTTEYLENLEHFIQTAHKYKLKLNFTFFDGNIVMQDNFAKYKDRWWNLLNDKFQTGEAYLANVIHPILNLLNRYPNVVTQIDLINEINALNGQLAIYPYVFEKSWHGINRFVCQWNAFIKQNIYYPLQVTASLGWGTAIMLILSNKLNANCIDFYDIHLYNNEGIIAFCDKLKAFSKRNQKPIWLGEFGQRSKSFNDELQVKNLQNFISNAKRCGLAGAMAWRLSDVRPGTNPEARFSFEANNQLRPAYYIFQNLNKNNF
jgi:endo-1,4-beta-mannosidase